MFQSTPISGRQTKDITQKQKKQAPGPNPGASSQAFPPNRRQIVVDGPSTHIEFRSNVLDSPPPPIVQLKRRPLPVREPRVPVHFFELSGAVPIPGHGTTPSVQHPQTAQHSGQLIPLDRALRLLPVHDALEGGFLPVPLFFAPLRFRHGGGERHSFGV